MSRWEQMGVWTGAGLRREVFFFECDGVELYGSLYAAEPLVDPLGVAICNSWGVEADQASRLVHPLALAPARVGGAGLVFHYPGHGDSQGDPGATTIDSMAAATVAALHEGRRRLPGCTWALAGVMLGAAVAALALERTDPAALLLAQPALRPSEYFAQVARRARRIAALADNPDESVFGYPLSTAMLASAGNADAPVAAALDRFAGRGAVVRYSSPKGTYEVPQRFEQIEVEGTWRFGAQDDSRLGRAAGEWLTRYMSERG